MAKVLPEALPDPKYPHRGKTFAAPKLEAEVLTAVVMPSSEVALPSEGPSRGHLGGVLCVVGRVAHRPAMARPMSSDVAPVAIRARMSKSSDTDFAPFSAIATRG